MNGNEHCSVFHQHQKTKIYRYWNVVGNERPMPSPFTVQLAIETTGNIENSENKSNAVRHRRRGVTLNDGKPPNAERRPPPTRSNGSRPPDRQTVTIHDM
jgi:hypothetical protein